MPVRRQDEPPPVPGDETLRRRAWRRDRLPAVALSLGVHAAILAAILSLRPNVTRLAVEPPVMAVALAPSPRPADTAGEAPSPAPAKASHATQPAAASPVKVHTAPLPPPPEVKPIAAAKAVAPTPSLSAAELAGAATAESGEAGGGGGEGSGGGGGSCNMVRRLQAALRRDALVQAAVRGPDTAGKAVKVWDGDWLQNGAQDGRGLAAVREAIIWEVAFAPAACRAQPMHGLVLLALADGPGATRLAMGGGAWRWSDLLTPRGGVVR